MSKATFYRLTYAYQRFVVGLGWALILATCACGALAGLVSFGLAPRLAVLLDPFLYLALALLALFLAASLLWLLLSPWYSIWFRSLAWWAARGGGAAWRWLTTGWRGALVLLAAVAFVAWLRDLLLGVSLRPADLVTLSFAGRVTAVAALLVLVSWAYLARKRVVVLSFADRTGDEDLAACIGGLAEQLLNELDRLGRLYRTIDEMRPTAGGETIDATVGVEDWGQFLQGAVTAESRISLGVLEIPVGAILAVVGRAVQGPRLAGSVHEEGQEIVVLAQIGGGGQRGSWRVSSADLPGDRDRAVTEALHQMIEQLAYRIFADLVQVGSPRWRAVYRYSQGLRAYRDTVRTRRDRSLKLFQAERAFLGALDEDNEFAQCHYNLGIVYRDLSRPESVEAALGEALNKDAGLYDACYALAVQYFRRESYDEVLLLCDRAIRLRPFDARAWDLAGLARHKLDQQAESIQSREIAAGLAWRALCRAVLGGKQDAKLRDVAQRCMRNLAVAHVREGNYARSKALFRQAIRLAPGEAELYFELGKTSYKEGDWQGAVSALKGISADALPPRDRAIYWACLAGAYRGLAARDGDENDRAARRARLRFVDVASTVDREALEGDVESVEYVGDAWEQVKQVQDALAEKEGEGQSDRIRRLQATLSDFRDLDWASAQVAAWLGQQLLDQDPAQAQIYLQQAIDGLHEEHPAVIRRQGLYGHLARACMLQNRLGEALAHARHAAALDPESAWERSVLGDIYIRMNKYEGAVTEFRTALRLSPADPDVLSKIASAYWSLGDAYRRPEQRREAFQQVVRFLHRALEIVENDWQEKEDPARDMEARGSLHYWLGRFHRELLEYDEAVYHLKIAYGTGFKPLESRVELAWTYVYVKAYDEAEAAFCEAAVETLAQRRQVGSSACPAERPGEESSIDALLAQIHLQSAFALADRGVNLQRAWRRIRHASRHVLQIDRSKRRPYEAALHECRGWIHFRNGEWDPAIAELEQAVARTASPEPYVHLATVCLARAQADASDRAAWRARARRACIHAREADLNGQYTSEIAGLLKQLDGEKEPAAQPPADARQVGITLKGALVIDS